MPLAQAGAGVSGPWSAVRGQWPAAGNPTGSLVGPEATLVVRGLHHDHRREPSLIEPDAGRALDSALAGLVTDVDPSRGEDGDVTSGGRVLPGAGEVEDGTTPERIPTDRIDPSEFARPVELPMGVRTVERGLIRIDTISDRLLDELAAAVVGPPGRPVVPADPIARPETSQQPGNVLAKLAATLIVAGSWGHSARFRGVTSRPPGRPRDRKESEQQSKGRSRL
jgi:hypothetical protein